MHQRAPGRVACLLLHAPDGSQVNRQRFGLAWRKLRAAASEVDSEGRSTEQIAEDTARSARLQAARFHDTRHTYASVLLSGGVSAAAAAEYLGHSPAELLSTYAHLGPQDHDRARSTVQAAFERDAACPTRVPGLAG